ncbi:MAG: hypothetical protein GX804_08445 [Lentisphaerae bacterium]|jgi:hypothetical protein|nr:hypothetical protein [Lentisphaerota bacterium]
MIFYSFTRFLILFTVGTFLLFCAGCEDTSFWYSRTDGTTSFAISNNLDSDIRVVYPDNSYDDYHSTYVPAHGNSSVSMYYDTTVSKNFKVTVIWGSNSHVYTVPHGTDHITVNREDFF